MALVGTLNPRCTAFVRAEAAKMFWEIAGAHGIRLEVHYPVPEFAFLVESNMINRTPPALAALHLGLYKPFECPRIAHIQLLSPPGSVITLRTAKLDHRQTCRLTVPYATPWHGHHGPLHPFRGSDNPGERRCGSASTSAPTSTCTTAAASESPLTDLGGATPC